MSKSLFSFIPPIAEAFEQEALNKSRLNFLMENDWEGNIRELENAIKHAFVKLHSSIIVITAGNKKTMG